jgi:hypothetical protein
MTTYWTVVNFDYVCGRASDAEPLVVPVYKGVR